MRSRQTVAFALAFAFEAEPRRCFERLGRLPFGCHRWQKFDRAFWEPHLLPATASAAVRQPHLAPRRYSTLTHITPEAAQR